MAFEEFDHDEFNHDDAEQIETELDETDEQILSALHRSPSVAGNKHCTIIFAGKGASIHLHEREEQSEDE